MDALGPAHGADVGSGVAASLLANVASLAEDMHRYLVERIPEVGGDAELRGLTWDRARRISKRHFRCSVMGST